MRFAAVRKEEARLRGLGLLLGPVSAERIPRSPNFKGLLLLRSFLLALLFRLSHVGTPVTGLVRGRSIRTRIKKTSKRARAVLLALIIDHSNHHSSERMNFQ